MARRKFAQPPFFLLFVIFTLVFLPVEKATAFVGNIPDGTVLDFTVMRKGSAIGTHTMTFQRRDGRVNVDIKTDIEVKVLFVPVYHFNHQSREIWNGDKLLQLVSTTDDDGTKYVLSIAGNATTLNVNNDGKTSAVPATTIPASLWHPDLAVPGKETVLNTLDGHLMAVDVAFSGEDKIQVRSRSIRAKHYIISGELKRELWYDPDGILVKVRFKGTDGSEIQYILK